MCLPGDVMLLLLLCGETLCDDGGLGDAFADAAVAVGALFDVVALVAVD